MKAKSGIYINFLPAPGEVMASHKDQCILDVALRSGIPIDHTCGGNGTCGTCLVQIVQGLEKLGPRNEVEAEMAEDRGFESHERLACQSAIVEGLTIQLKQKET